MKAVIVETNVIAVVNFEADHADLECVSACAEALETAQRKRVVVIDSAMLFFEEYLKHARLSGQPHLGDSFVKWLWDNQANARRCEKVTITPSPDEPDDFAEFPDDPELQGFDRSDRKFVAVALASRRRPTILNAVDTDWWIYRGQLSRHEVAVRFLCPKLMKDK